MILCPCVKPVKAILEQFAQMSADGLCSVKALAGQRIVHGSRGGCLKANDTFRGRTWRRIGKTRDVTTQIQKLRFVVPLDERCRSACRSATARLPEDAGLDKLGAYGVGTRLGDGRPCRWYLKRPDQRPNTPVCGKGEDQ